MSTRRWISLVFPGLAVAGALAVSLEAQQPVAKPAMGHDMPMQGGMSHDPMPMTTAQKITNAMSAAPASVSANATILDWPAKDGDAPPVLRKGTNAWTCLPDMPDTKGNDPMCLDASWMKWVEAYMAHKAPDVKTPGVGYMLAPGGGWESNTDPFAMKETADNQWSHHPPHMMFLVPDVKTLETMSKDPANGGPYVMYAGTPYAHIMAPAGK